MTAIPTTPSTTPSTTPASTTPTGTPSADRRKRMARALIARIGDELFAFSIAGVSEAVDAPQVTPLPLVPDGVAGQTTYRGQLLPVLDPRALLGTARGEGAGTLLVMPGPTRYGLWVDDLKDMVAVESDQRRPLPQGSDRTGMLTGLLVVDEDLAGVVNLEAMHAAAHALLTSETSQR